jgi:hypothetical protein
VTTAQQQALLQQAVATLSKDDEQRKAKEGIAPATEASAALPASPSKSTDGLWRGTYECGRNGNFKPFTLKPEVRLKSGNGTWYTTSGSATNDNTLGISVAIDGTKVRVTRRTTSSGGSISSGANADTSPLFGWLEGNAILASNNKCTMVLVRVASSTAVATAPPTAFVITTYDATYSGALGRHTVAAGRSAGGYRGGRQREDAADATWAAFPTTENPACAAGIGGSQLPSDWQVDIKGNTLTSTSRSTKRSFTVDLKALQPDGSGRVVGKDDKNREFYVTFDPGSGARPFHVANSITPCRYVFTPKT